MARVTGLEPATSGVTVFDFYFASACLSLPYIDIFVFLHVYFK